MLVRRNEEIQGLEELRVLLEELGLGGYEARVLLALIQVGTAPATQLSKLADVPRTSVYPILDELGAKRLAQRIPAEGPAVWAACGRDEILDQLLSGQEVRVRDAHQSQENRLQAAQEERLRELNAGREESLRAIQARIDRAREVLSVELPPVAAQSLPYIHMITQASQVNGVYERLLAEARSELLFVNRPPYSTPSTGKPAPAVLDALARKIRIRALYETGQFKNPDLEAFWQEAAAYHEAGVEGRMSAHLSVKLVICDRKAALVGMTDPTVPDGGYPTLMLIEHPAFAALAATAFDAFWESAKPYRYSPPRRRRPG